MNGSAPLPGPLQLQLPLFEFVAIKMTAKSASNQRGKPFTKGQSGNPAGKPKGTRHKAHAILDALLADGAEAVARALVDAAKGGDITTARWLLDRIAPARKDVPIIFDLPAVTADAQSLVSASSAIIQAVSVGQITPSEACAIQSLIDRHRAIIETADLAARVAELENERA